MIRKTTSVCSGKSWKHIGTLLIRSNPLMSWYMVLLVNMEEEMNRAGYKISLMACQVQSHGGFVMHTSRYYP